MNTLRKRRRSTKVESVAGLTWDLLLLGLSDILSVADIMSVTHPRHNQWRIVSDPFSFNDPWIHAGIFMSPFSCFFCGTSKSVMSGSPNFYMTTCLVIWVDTFSNDSFLQIFYTSLLHVTPWPLQNFWSILNKLHNTVYHIQWIRCNQVPFIVLSLENTRPSDRLFFLSMLQFYFDTKIGFSHWVFQCLVICSGVSEQLCWSCLCRVFFGTLLWAWRYM